MMAKQEQQGKYAAMGSVGGVAFPGGRVKVKTWTVELYKGKNSAQPPAPTIILRGKDANAADVTVLWGMGSGAHKRFRVTPDKRAWTMVTTGDQLGGGTKAGMLMENLFSLGCKPLLMQHGFGFLDGAVLDTRSEPYTLSEDFKKQHAGAKDSTVILVSKIVSLNGIAVPTPIGAETEGEEVEQDEDADDEDADEADGDEEADEADEDDGQDENGKGDGDEEADEEADTVDLREWAAEQLAKATNGKPTPFASARSAVLLEAGNMFDETAIEGVVALLEEAEYLASIGFGLESRADEKGRKKKFIVPLQKPGKPGKK